MAPAARGFTIVELVVTTSLMALIGGATVAALGGGVRVWERGVEFGIHRQAALILFTQMRHEFQNARLFRPIPFEGAYDEVTFAAAIRSDPEEPAGELGQLGYYLDDRRHRLCRSFVPYRRMKRDRLRDACQVMLEDVTRVRFSYLGADPERGSTHWGSRWEQPAAPLALKAEITMERPRHGPSVHTFVVYLPVQPLPGAEEDDDAS